MKRNTPLKRSTKPIRRVSKKRAKQLRTYSTLRKEFLALHPICQVWLKEQGITESDTAIFHLLLDDYAPRATEVHHMNRRNGARLNDEAYWLAVCAEAHRRIHAEPSWARAEGFLK